MRFAPFVVLAEDCRPPAIARMNKARRVLVYGFGPYRQFPENITAKIIKSLKPAAGLKRIVFPVRFHRGQFLEALARYKPEAVLGLGQSSRRDIEIESRGANRRRARQGARLRRIRQRGPLWLSTTLDLKLGRNARVSGDAGDYVCNFSIYLLLDQIQRTGAKTRLAFIHIPHDCALGRARRFVVSALRQLGAR